MSEEKKPQKDKQIRQVLRIVLLLILLVICIWIRNQERHEASVTEMPGPETEQSQMAESEPEQSQTVAADSEQTQSPDTSGYLETAEQKADTAEGSAVDPATFPEEDPADENADRETSDIKTAEDKTKPGNEQDETLEGVDEYSDEDRELPDRDGYYYSKEDVSFYIECYGELPQNYLTKKEAEKLGWSGGSLERYAPGKVIGGSRFGNYEGLLPEAKGRIYYECDIDTQGKKSRGPKRIVFSNDGLIYYTADHYKTFELLYGDPDQ